MCVGNCCGSREAVTCLWFLQMCSKCRPSKNVCWAHGTVLACDWRMRRAKCPAWQMPQKTGVTWTEAQKQNHWWWQGEGCTQCLWTQVSGWQQCHYVRLTFCVTGALFSTLNCAITESPLTLLSWELLFGDCLPTGTLSGIRLNQT